LLSSKVILVTGACGLLGKQIVKEIIEQNGCVLATDTDTDKAESLFQALPSEQIQFEPLDLFDSDSIDLAIASGVKQFGSVHACVNSAYPRSKNWGTVLENLTMEDIQEHLKLQLGGAILLSQRIMKHFISQGHGNFIQLSSIQGIAASKFEHYEGTSMYSSLEYSVAKSGIISMTSWLAKYYKNKNIRVNCVSPGGILDQQPQSFLEKYRNSCTSKGMLDPTDVAGTVLFLLSDKSKYINGQNIVIDDGWSL
jgi:NAD(P)-dependent dehydrogenase (short-subunit alcohol dehydrogenase family)